MSEIEIHLVITPQQAKTIAAALELSRQVLATAPGVPVYPNLGNFDLERDLIQAELNATQEAVHEQLDKQMPRE